MKTAIRIIIISCIAFNCLFPALEAGNQYRAVLKAVMSGNSAVTDFFTMYSFSSKMLQKVLENLNNSKQASNSKKPLPAGKDTANSSSSDAISVQNLELNVKPASNSCGYSVKSKINDISRELVPYCIGGGVPRNRGATGELWQFLVFLIMLSMITLLPRGAIDAGLMNFAYVRVKSRL